MLAVNTLIHSISCSLVVAPCSVTFTNYKFRTQTTVDHFHRFIHGAYLAISVQVTSPCSIPHKLPVPCTKNLHKPSLFNPSRLEILWSCVAIVVLDGQVSMAHRRCSGRRHYDSNSSDTELSEAEESRKSCIKRSKFVWCNFVHCTVVSYYWHIWLLTHRLRW